MALSVQVPIETPSAERMEELYLEAVKAAVAQRETWLSLDEAAAHLKMSRRSFDRLREKYLIPIAVFGEIKIVLRADLDALAKAHLCTPGGLAPVLQFPSQAPKPAQAQSAA